jgi:hypothetical protein
MKIESRGNSIAHQLLNHGIGSVSKSAAEAIAATVPEKPRIVEAKVLVSAVKQLVSDKKIKVVNVGNHVVLE